MTLRPDRRRALSLLTLIFGLALTVALPTLANAQSAEELRASGQAGERFDGYLEARDASVQAAVERVNAERRQVYEQRAKEQGVEAASVGKVYATQIYGKLPAGAWFKQADGTWIQKPAPG